MLNVTVLYPLTEFYRSLRLNRLLFAGADILGILLLGIFFWFYTRRMIRPLTINRRKQTEFIAAASHELRSPLTLMLSCLSSMDGASAKERERFSAIMIQEGLNPLRLGKRFSLISLCRIVCPLLTPATIRLLPEKGHSDVPDVSGNPGSISPRRHTLPIGRIVILRGKVLPVAGLFPLG